MRRCRHFLRHDRRGVAAIEAAFVLPAFLGLLFLIIQLGVYFTLQSVLDVAVLMTGETLRSNLAAGNYTLLQSTSVLTNAIVTNGSSLISASKLSVDVRKLLTLSGSSVSIANETIDCSLSTDHTCNGITDGTGNGSVLVLRAKMTMTLVPYTTVLTMTSMAIVRVPPS